MTALADATRQLTDTQDLMTLGEIKEKINTIEEEYKIQTELIDQMNEIFSDRVTYEENELDSGLIDGSITVLDNENVTKLREEALFGLSNLTVINLPNCSDYSGSIPFIEAQNLQSCVLGFKNLKSQTFLYNNSLQTLLLPRCEEVKSFAIFRLDSLTNLQLPVCKKINRNAFNHLKSLKEITLPACEYIEDGAFDVEVLASYYFPGSKMCSISNSLAFPSKYEASHWEDGNVSGGLYKKPTFYVPASMVEDYKTYGAWSELASQIQPIP